MIKIENTDVYGWEAAIRGLRNPLNSWERSDSAFDRDPDYGCSGPCPCCDFGKDCDECKIGPNDLDLMKRMIVSSEQSKYRRMITVTFDTVAPLYWYKEMDTYKVGTVCNSCSTMHTIHKKEFELDDFSHDRLNETCKLFLEQIVSYLNLMRDAYIRTKEKEYWYQMIQLLPSSYNQRRTYQMNYEVLASIYRQRKNHKLKEWVDFCKWIEELPYSELIIGKEE